MNAPRTTLIASLVGLVTTIVLGTILVFVLRSQTHPEPSPTDEAQKQPAPSLNSTPIRSDETTQPIASELVQHTAPQPAPTPQVNVEWKELPPDYKGDDIKALFDGIRRRFAGGPGTRDYFQKDEFETGAQFSERRRTSLSGPLVAGRGIDSIFAAIRPNKYGLDFWYAIDAREFIHDDSEDLVDLGTFDFEFRDSYLGSNAFGVNREVKAFSETQLSLRFVNREEFPEAIKLPMAPDSARAAKDHLRVVYLFVLEPDYIDVDILHHQPTIDEPYDSTTYVDIVVANLKWIWVVRLDTNEILLKVEPISGK